MTLIDTETGEIIDQTDWSSGSRVPAIPDRAESLPEVRTICEQVEQWVESETNPAVISEAAAKLGAVGEYLRLTSTEGRGRIEQTVRRLEARLGRLMERATGGRGKKVPEGGTFDHRRRSDFRKIAEHSDLIDSLESTDTDPLTRSRLLKEIETEEANRIVRELNDLAPEGFDPVLDKQLATERGALMRCCRDIAQGMTAAEFVERQGDFIKPRFFDTARAAQAWLADFIALETS